MIPTLEVNGPQYPGRRAISEIFKELKRQADDFKDYVVSTSQMSLRRDPTHGIVLSFPIGETTHQFPMSKRTYLQLAQWLGLPTNSRLYKRLRFGYEKRTSEDSDRFWNTWISLVNDHFLTIRSRKLIRTLKRQDGLWYARALLSDKYRVIPNDQLFLAVADKMQEMGVEFWDARLSEDAFYVYAVAPGISAQIREDRPFDTKGKRWVGDAGDTVNAALMMRNSETGQGGCEVCPAIVTGVNDAYFVANNRLSMRHVGKAHEMDSLLSAETIKKKNAVIYDEVRDYCVGTFTEEIFRKLVDQLQDATQDEVEDPLKAAEAVRTVYDLTEERKDAVCRWLMESGDRSRYGLARAVSREAHENKDLTADDAVHLERVSSDIIHTQTSLKLARSYKDKEVKKANKEAEKATRAELVGAGPDMLDF